MKKYLKTGKYFNNSVSAIILSGILFFAFNYYLSRVFGLNPDLIIWSDTEGYYQYLPSLFIKNDLIHMGYAIPLDNGMMFNKYTCGVAILEMPFFLVTHLFVKIFGDTASGYTSVYGMSIWFAACTYAYLGLVLLFRFLRNWFNKLPSLLAVLAIYFASNLFYYTAISPGYSHVYSFFVLAWFLISLDKFLKKPAFINTLFCGISIGLALLIRPTNGFYLLLFCLYKVNSFSSLKARWKWIFNKWKYFLLMLLIVFIVFLPQIFYWHAVTGKYFTYSYGYSAEGSESFIYWKSPKMGYVLFGVESGWLIYSPLFFFFLGGLLWTLAKKSHHSIAILILFLLITYANASWWCFTFSCGFGHRAFIEYYPLFTIPIAFIFQKVFASRKKALIRVLGVSLVVFSMLNLRMSYFYLQDQCWEWPNWKWQNYKKAVEKTFFLIPKSENLR